MRYAGFWIRLVADIIDTAILTFVSWLLELTIIGAVYWVAREPMPFADFLSPLMKQVMDAILYLAVALPYYVIGHYRYGTTLGKYPFGIYVVSAKTRSGITLTQSWIRCLSYALSYLPFCAGFIMAALHPEKRALHDLIAGTISIRKNREEATAP
jgi:uncharacterized RDD family membrane protein YckC